MKVLAVIPARYQSSRFPGKPLVHIGGRSMIQRVYDQVKTTSLIDKVVVATDHQAIFTHLKSTNRDVMMTSEAHQSGTDRVAEVAKQYDSFDVIINVQGDEPFIQQEQISTVVRPFMENVETQITTLAKSIENQALLFNPNVVKVIFNAQHSAIYFSRHPLPYLRDIDQSHWLTHHNFYQHIGLYGFRRDTLLAITKLPQSNLEKAESLEQLRWLEHQYPIQIAFTDTPSYGIDTPEDLERVKQLFNL